MPELCNLRIKSNTNNSKERKFPCFNSEINLTYINDEN